MHQAGSSLIESLIALLLISIALLGIAGLQLVTLQDARDARWRVEAVSLASGVLERMRASSDDAVAFEVAGSPPAIAGCPTKASICSSMTDWLAEVQRILPNGLANIDVTSNSDINKVTISLRWRQKPFANGDPLPSCGSDAVSGGCVMLETWL